MAVRAKLVESRAEHVDDERRSGERQRRWHRASREDSSCACPDCRLPADGPPAWLRDKAVSIWCGDYFTQLADELGEDAAEECILAFASGFEKGLVMAMIKPEWGLCLLIVSLLANEHQVRLRAGLSLSTEVTIR
jgi:hypothetical protein